MSLKFMTELTIHFIVWAVAKRRVPFFYCPCYDMENDRQCNPPSLDASLPLARLITRRQRARGC